MPTHREVIERLAAKNEQLRDVLETLVDLQNGCPLPKYRDEWNATMARAYQVLGRGEWKEME